MDYKKYIRKFGKEQRQIRQEKHLTKKLEKEKRKSERYLSLTAEDRRIASLKKELEDTRGLRGKRRRKVKIGGFRFEI